ncbi:MAG: DUF3604 domain-containing protein [Candidatus Binatia bacterium]|nr:DUF3604 domain-containing protein [Candidatus Binatia bacterium]MDG2010399.1 DUF3604 domain-containing protein [Candidatus Binatia bacterium]
MRIHYHLLSFLLIALLPHQASAELRPYSVTEEREPCTDYDPLKRPFFGDTHIHTAFSFDASTQDTRNRPRDAYRFARGEELGIQPYDARGEPARRVQLDRPLDFTSLSDHAEFLGDVRICRTPGEWSYWHPVCVAFRHSPPLGLTLLAAPGLIYGYRWGFCGEEGEACDRVAGSVWEEIQAAAEEAYDRSSRCEFTSFVGYEWTGSVGEGQNLHRNVIFRNALVPALPPSWRDTESAWALWDRLESECVEGLPGCDALTIPHNSNLSGGLMFESARASRENVDGLFYGKGEPVPSIDAEEAARRSRWEPLVEIMQHKGDSECDRRAGWGSDEFCDFEKLPYDRFGAKTGGSVGEIAPRRSFTRAALSQGLAIREAEGANPFQFGQIAATDTHLGTPGLVAEKDHPGHGGAGMHSGGGSEVVGLPDDIEFGPGGLAVLWAEENTRDSLFHAMQRREAYGTSGTRPIVRFFGGWDLPEDLCARSDLVATGYARGVAMGSVLPASGKGNTRGPRFVVHATRDSGTGKDAGGPLQRIQIIKGWRENGEPQEKVLDVAGGDNGVTVDPRTCEPSGGGAAVLCAVWEDPEFDAGADAFYYARVIENPSCRWSQYACNKAQISCAGDVMALPEGLRPCCDPEYPGIQQERAWTSPIWFEPAEGTKDG